jgi:hypothetical protein
MFTIIKELDNDYNKPKLFVHALLIAVQALSVCWNTFEDSEKAFVTIIFTDFVC